MDISPFISMLPKAAQGMLKAHRDMVRVKPMPHVTWNRLDYDLVERAVRDACKHRGIQFEMPLELDGAVLRRFEG